MDLETEPIESTYMKYYVDVKEVHTVSLTVEARNRCEAIRKAKETLETGIPCGSLDYSHTLDPDDWNVEKADDES